MIDFLFLDENTCYMCKEEPIYRYHICRDCFDKLDYVDNHFYIDEIDAYSIYYYNEFMKKYIADYKFERNTSLSKVFSQILYDYGKSKNLFDVDYILPSPSSKKTLINRGFDHIKMLTDDFTYKLDATYLKSFKKVKNTKSQHDLDKDQRSKNLIGAFICNEDLTDKSVLIIDDLITTGNTVREIIKILKQSNVKKISVLCIASERRVI